MKQKQPKRHYERSHPHHCHSERSHPHHCHSERSAAKSRNLFINIPQLFCLLLVLMFITIGCENKLTKLPEPTKSLHKAAADGDSNQVKLLLPKESQEGPYLKAVREFAYNVLKHGRDTYSPKHTPLFVDSLNIQTQEPVKWISPEGERWILSNLASQQTLMRTFDGLLNITGDPKYCQAAMDAIKYAFENLRSPNGLLYWANGLLYWGGHVAYDAGRNRA